MKLGALCNVVRGSSPRPQGDARFYGGPIPRLMVADLTRDGKHVRPQIDSLTIEGARLSRPMKAGDVVIAVSGNPGLTAILVNDACIHDGFVGLRDLEATRLTTDFLYRYLTFIKDQNHGLAVGAIFKNLTTDQIKDIDVPLPPLSEQKRIAAILDKADELREKRRQALAKLDTLTQSLFLEMFGDPIHNERKWALDELGEMARVERGKFTPRPRGDPSFYGGRFPFIQTGDISNSGGRLRLWSQTLNDKGVKVSRSFPPGTVARCLTGKCYPVTLK